MKQGMIIAMALLQISIVQKAIAQEDVSLDPVTVTSSLIEKRSSETGRNISIIKGAYFHRLPVHSLDELLKFIPGIEVQARGPQGSQSDLSMRGGTFQQVLVILDGLRLNDPNTGHFSAYIPITPAEIDRIEVLKGASAAIYGSEAVGGVINIITKTFHAPKQSNTKNINALLAAGAYGLVNTNLGGFFTNKKITLGAGILANHSSGVPQRGANGFFHNTSGSAALSYTINPYWQVSFRSAYDTRHFAAQNFYTTSIRDTASEKIRSWWHQARLQYEKGNSSITADAGYKKLHDQFAFNPSTAPNNNFTQLFQSLIVFRQVIREETSLITGLNFQQKKINSNDRGNHTLNTMAPFVSFVQKIGDHFSLLPSLRMEFIKGLPAEFVPQVTASFTFPNVQLRASGGKTIRDADFTERYNNYGKATVGSGQRIGNPALAVEKSWGYETGFDWFYRHSFKFSTTFFQRFHTQLIDWVNTNYADMPRKDNLVTSGTYGLAKNISAVHTTGWETELLYQKKWDEAKRLFLNGGVVWLYSKSSEPQPSFYISSHARFLTNFAALYEYGAVSLSFTGIYKNRQPQQASAIQAAVSKDYFLLNGRASYHLIKNKLTLFLQLDNIFNKKYSDLLGTPMPGRWVQGGLSITAP